MNRFLVLILIIGSAIGVSKGLREFRQEQHLARNTWPSQLAPALEQHLAANLLHGRYPESHTSVYQLLYMTHQIVAQNYDLRDTVRRGVIEAGAASSEATLITEAVLGLHSEAEALGVFEETTNLLQLERGKAPKVGNADWADELLSIGHRFPPTLGPELIHSLPNLALMPESASAMQSEVAPPSLVRVLSQWERAGIISPRTAESVRERYARQEAGR